ncbi:hypothetical protein [Paenibacillus amylolyticus]|uniref:hypothetical protein n=1 Tax=Paenibacillus amylolyticus TaxID=1451 RepID=UPI003D96C629
MNIRIVPIDQINATAYNPRVDLQPGDPEYEKLKRSIEEFGYVEPVVWNEHRKHGRRPSMDKSKTKPVRISKEFDNVCRMINFEVVNCG